jgi:hypothetical protein
MTDRVSRCLFVSGYEVRRIKNSLYKIVGVQIADESFNTKTVTIDSFIKYRNVSKIRKDGVVNYWNSDFWESFGDSVFYVLKLKDIKYLGVSLEFVSGLIEKYKDIGGYPIYSNDFIIARVSGSELLNFNIKEAGLLVTEKGKVIAEPKYPVVTVNNINDDLIKLDTGISIFNTSKGTIFRPKNLGLDNKIINKRYRYRSIIYRFNIFKDSKITSSLDFRDDFGGYSSINDFEAKLDIDWNSIIKYSNNREFIGFDEYYTFVKSENTSDVLMLPKDCKYIYLTKEVYKSNKDNVKSLVLSKNILGFISTVKGLDSSYLGDNFSNLSGLYFYKNTPANVIRDCIFTLFSEESWIAVRDSVRGVYEFYNHGEISLDVFMVRASRLLTALLKRDITITFY